MFRTNFGFDNNIDKSYVNVIVGALLGAYLYGGVKHKLPY